MIKDQTQVGPKSQIATTLVFAGTVFLGLFLVGVYAIIPTWQNMFVDFGAKLPAVTQFVL